MSTVVKETAMKSNLGLSKKVVGGVIDRLTALLSDEHLLYVKVRNYHWNVEGPNFKPLHEFFEEQYDALGPMADEIAERIRALGGTSIGTMSEFLEHARLKEQPGERLTATEMCQRLLDDHEALVRTLREDVEFCQSNGDEVTGDMLIGFMKDHAKTAWMLRATIAE